ncbi:MAG: deoxynucleoside kinase [Myxococcales bacterium]|nr:deoxynucleoside kinase [Myxococcales bacterium]
MTRYLVVEGLIGVGKTTLCRLLERERGATLFLEPAATNPFLEPFYADPERYAFPVQMFYLYNRWRQQTRIRQGDLFSGLVVSDYLFEKDRLFASKTLNAEELELYDRFAGALGEQAPRPDLVIYLEAPIDVILSRIDRRRAPGEQAITEEYLVDLRDRYERLLADWDRCPLIRLDNQALNYADDPEAQTHLLRTIDQALSGEPLRGDLAAGSANADRQVQQDLFGRR